MASIKHQSKNSLKESSIDKPTERRQKSKDVNEIAERLTKSPIKNLRLDKLKMKYQSSLGGNSSRLSERGPKERDGGRMSTMSNQQHYYKGIDKIPKVSE